MRWPPYKHIFFDCDSTLTTVEGIDVLAESAGKKWRVETLTRAAMNGELELEDIYAKRLRAVKPTREQIRKVRRVYKRNAVEDAAAVVATLQSLGHEVYIISGGLAEPVEEFGIHLGVPRQNIRAVGVSYNALSGNWWDDSHETRPAGNERYMSFHRGALTLSDGKAQIVRELLGHQSGRSLLIGDGYSDLLAGQAVDLFVGFGGVAKRERVLAQAPVFVHSRSLAPLLTLAAGPAARRWLDAASQERVFSKGLDLIVTGGAVTFTDERLKQKFDKALHAAH